MKEWKNKFMQEMACELHIMRQAYGEEMEAQKQGFQIKLEWIEQGFKNKLEQVDGKLKKIELRSKIVEIKVKALRFLGQLVNQNLLPTKAVTELSNNNPNKWVEK